MVARIRNAALLLVSLAFLPAISRGQEINLGPGFRGYLGPNVYAPGYYSAYGYTMPRYTYRGPGFNRGTPSGNPGYLGGYPYDYRGSNGVFDFGYPGFYNNYGYGTLPTRPLAGVRASGVRRLPRRPASPPRLVRIGR